MERFGQSLFWKVKREKWRSLRTDCFPGWVVTNYSTYFFSGLILINFFWTVKAHVHRRHLFGWKCSGSDRLFKLCLHWQRLRANTGDNDSDSDMKQYLHCHLGDMKQIQLCLFFVTSPKVANASTVSCWCHCCCRCHFRCGWRFCLQTSPMKMIHYLPWPAWDVKWSYLCHAAQGVQGKLSCIAVDSVIALIFANGNLVMILCLSLLKPFLFSVIFSLGTLGVAGIKPLTFAWWDEYSTTMLSSPLALETFTLI